MSKNYVDYMVEETKNILAIDSPSGYTKEMCIRDRLWSGHRCRLNKAGDEPILYRKRQKLTKDKWTEWQRKKSVRSKKKMCIRDSD